MAAKFEISLDEALRQIAEFQLKATGLGKSLDQLNDKSKRGGTAAGQLMSEMNKTYTALQQNLLNLNSETKRSKEAIDAAFSKIRATATKAFESIATANTQATVKAQAYSGALKDVQRVMTDTANKNVYAQAMQKIATIQEKSLGDAKVLTYQLQQLATAQGQVTADLKVRLATETKLATAQERQVGSNKDLTQQLKMLSSALGEANSVLKAQISAQTKAQQEDVKAASRLAELKRGYDSLAGGMQAQIAQQQAMNQGLVQAATYRERELNQIAELTRKQQSLNGGSAEIIASLKAQNTAREQQITQDARYMSQIDLLRSKLTSLSGGAAEDLTRLKAQVSAREQQIKTEERYAQTVTQLTTAQAMLTAQGEARMRSAQALNSVTLEQARATNTLTEADAKAIALAEKLIADGRARSTALLDEARAAHGMSAAQQELNSARQREEAQLAKLKTQLEQVNSSYGRESSAIQQQIKEQEALNRLRALSISQLLGLTSAEDRHNASLNAGSQLTASMRAAITGLGQSFGMYTSGTIVAASSTYALFKAMKDTVSLGADFTASMAQANAVMNANNPTYMPDTMKAMETQVRALGQTTVFTASEVAKGLIDLGQAGLSSGQAIMALKPVLDMAQIGNMSMSESADIATNTMMIFGKQASDLTNVVDIMATAAVDSNTDIKQLANALSYAGPAAEAAGISLEETAAAIEVLSNSGIKSSRAGTALRKLFTSLLNPTEEGAKVLAKYNIATQNVDGSTRNLVDVVGDLNKALNATGVTEAQRLSAIQDLVGLYATSPVAALVKNADQLKGALDTLENNVTGAAERMRNKMSDTLQVDWKGTMSAYEELQLQVYDKFETYLRTTSARITATLLSLTEPIKVVLDKDLSSQSIDDLVAKANANSKDSGRTYTVNTGADGVKVARDQSGYAASTQQLVDSMAKLDQSQITVINNLDLMVEKFETFGTVAVSLIGGLIAAKGFGGLSAAMTGVGQIFGELSARAAAASLTTGALSARLATLNVAAKANITSILAWGASVNAARTSSGLWAASLLVVQGAATGAAKAVQLMALAIGAVARFAGIVGVIASIGYAIYTAFGNDATAEIVDHKKEVEDLKKTYADLNAELDQVGQSKEREAMLQQVKALNESKDAVAAHLEELIKTKQAYLDIAGAAPKSLLLQIGNDEQQLQKINGELINYQNNLDKTGLSTKEVTDRNKQYTDTMVAQVAQQKVVDDARTAAQLAMDDSAVQKWALYDKEKTLLDDIVAKMKDQVKVIQTVGNTAIAVQDQINTALNKARADADKAFVKEQSPGERFDSTLKQMQTVQAEIDALQAKSEKTGVTDPTLAIKIKEQAAAMVANAKANAELNQVIEAGAKSRQAAELAGLPIAEKATVYQKQLNDLTAQRAKLDADVASGAIGQGAYQEQIIQNTEMQTTAKNGLASANNSLEASSRKAEKAQDSWNNKYGDFIGKQQAATTAALAEAAAYASGSNAVAEYQIQKEKTNEILTLETEKVKLSVDQQKELEAAIRSRINAEQKRDVEKALDDLDRETKDLWAQTQAVVGGEAALRSYNVQKQVEQTLMGKDPALRAEMIKQVEREAEAHQRAADILEKTTRGNTLINQYNKGMVLAKEYAKDIEAVNLRYQEGGITAEQYKKAIKGVTDEYEDNKAQLTVWGKLTTEALNRIDESFVNMWKNIGHGFSDFRTSLLDSFKQMLAELAHEAITKPIMISFMNTVLGTNKSGGISDVLSGLGAASNAGGGGGISLAGVANTASSIYSLATGVGPAWMSGYASGGVMGGVSGVGSYYTGLVSSAANTVASWFSSAAGTAAATAVGQTAAQAAVASAAGQGAASTGFGYGGSLVAGEVGSASYAAPASTGGMAYAWPLAILMGMYQSGKLYDSGVRYDKDAIEGSKLSKTADKLGTAGIDRKIAFESIGLADKALSGLFGGKVGAILSGSTFAMAVEGYISSKLFGTGYQTKDSGLSLQATNGDLVAQSYQDQKKKKGLLGGSNKKRTVYSALGDDQEQQLQELYAATQIGVIDLVKQIGITVSDGAFDAMKIAEMKISTQGKTDEEIQKAVAGWFSYASDVMVATLDKGVGGFGYSFAELARRINVFTGFNAQLKLIDVTMLKLSAESMEFANAMVDAAGGVDKMTANLNAYYDAFFSDTDKSAKSLEQMRKVFTDLNVALPDTRDGYRQMVSALDLSTEAGQKMFLTLTSAASTAAGIYDILESRQATYYSAFYSEAENTAMSMAKVTAEFKKAGVTLPATREGYRALVDGIDKSTTSGKALYDTLMNLAGSADTFYKAQQSAQEAAQTASMSSVNTAFSVLQKSVDAQKTKLTDAYNARVAALNDMAATAQQTVTDLTSMGTALSNALKALNNTSESTVKILREQAKATLEQALATQRSGGSLSGVTGLEDALSTLSENSTDSYATLEDFNRDQGRTANMVAELNLTNDAQLTSAQQLLKAVQNQIIDAKTQFDAQMEALDAQLEAAQKQIDALNGINNSVLSVADALAAFQAAVAAAIAAAAAVKAPATGGTYTGGTGTAGAPSYNDINAIYQQVLGRDADAAGAVYWGGQAGNMSAAQLAAAIKADAQTNGELPKYATGGRVVGDGTSTSDSILAWLSNGEYVMNANAVSMMGVGALDQINAGITPTGYGDMGGLADIGYTEPLAAPGQSSGSSGCGPALLEEVKVLRAETRQAQFQIAKYGKQVADLLRKWDEEGSPKERDYAQ